MRKTFITIALFVVLGGLTVSCQKSLLKQDFIPSGEYPISVNDKDIVIQISCQPIN